MGTHVSKAYHPVRRGILFLFSGLFLLGGISAIHEKPIWSAIWLLSGIIILFSSLVLKAIEIKENRIIILTRIGKISKSQKNIAIEYEVFAYSKVILADYKASFVFLFLFPFLVPAFQGVFINRWFLKEAENGIAL
jgi:hypothetical protein